MKNLSTLIILSLTIISFSSCNLKGLGNGENGSECGQNESNEAGELNNSQNCNVGNIGNLPNIPGNFVAPADSAKIGTSVYHECFDAQNNSSLCVNGSVFHQFGGTPVKIASFSLNSTSSSVCFIGDGVTSYVAQPNGVVTVMACN